MFIARRCSRKVEPVSRSEASKSSEIQARGPLLSVVIVNFNAWQEVENLCRRLVSAPEVEAGLCEIVIVDNASEGPIPEFFIKPTKGLKLIARRENGGFSVGVNAGWRNSRSSWLLLLNPDLIASETFLGQIINQVKDFEANPGGAPGIVGYALRNADGSRQHSVGVFPTLLRAVWEQFLPRSRRKYQTAWKTRPGSVDWVTGACMLVNARMLEVLGGLDEDFFLYYEEVALCRAASRMGWRVEYDPRVEAVHLHPLQTRTISPLLRVITRHSKMLYFRKFRPRVEFLALCGIVAVESWVKTLKARLVGDRLAVRTWETVGAIERELRNGANLGGVSVLKLAESAAGVADVPIESSQEWVGVEDPAASRPRTG